MLKVILVLIFALSINECIQIDHGGWKIVDDSFDEFQNVMINVKWAVRNIPAFTKYLGIYTVIGFRMPLSARIKKDNLNTKYWLNLNADLKYQNKSTEVSSYKFVKINYC